MGWLSDLWDDIVDWFQDTWDEMINKIEDYWRTFWASWRTTLHYFNQWIAKWLSTAAGFFIVVGGLVLFTIFLPQISDWFWGTTIGTIITESFAFLKSGLGGLIDVRTIIDLVALSNALRILWPQWRKATDAVNACVSSWAEELGVLASQVHAYFACAYALTAASVSIAGFPPRMAAVEWYQGANKWAKKMDEDFYTYAERPERLYSDIIDKWLIPEATRSTDAQVSQQQEIRDHRDKLREQETSLIEAKESIDHFIEVMPADIRAEFNKRWEAFSQEFDAVALTIREEIWAKYDEIMAIVDERDMRIMKLQEAIERNNKSPMGIIAGSAEWSDAERELFAEFIYQAVLARQLVVQGEGVEEAYRISDEAWLNMEEALKGIKAVPSLAYEPEGLYVPVDTAESSKIDWFVGEF